MIERTVALVIVMLAVASITSCGKSNSAIEGTLVDWNGMPVTNAKVVAILEEPLIKGYEMREGTTASDGTFRIAGLYPFAWYKLQPASNRWTCQPLDKICTGPVGETKLLDRPLQIHRAFTYDGSLIHDLSSGRPRFSKNADGIIHDVVTEEDWIIGPNRDFTHAEAKAWAESCTLDGGGWQLPAGPQLRESIGMMEQEGWKLNPAIKGWRVWAHWTDEGWAWIVEINGKHQYRMQPFDHRNHRVVAVRERR